MNFKTDLAAVLNAHGFDTLTNTPDHELAEFLAGILLIMPRPKRRPALLAPCFYCEERHPTGAFLGKPCCGPCSERMLKAAPTTIDPLPGPRCHAYHCDGPATALFHGEHLCERHFKEFSQLPTAPE